MYIAMKPSLFSFEYTRDGKTVTKLQGDMIDLSFSPTVDGSIIYLFISKENNAHGFFSSRQAVIVRLYGKPVIP